ncbi:unnamed protein product [Bemisia tabaci]|uniref:Uncharacterized protein n=1 Tax=Bemisia tabaci TaxID=7038 RepID=A0A9P0A295_BEMTA|nr:unnamed protein product [Bemisia tabaci]
MFLKCLIFLAVCNAALSHKLASKCNSKLLAGHGKLGGHGLGHLGLKGHRLGGHKIHSVKPSCGGCGACVECGFGGHEAIVAPCDVEVIGHGGHGHDGCIGGHLGLGHGGLKEHVQDECLGGHLGHGGLKGHVLEDNFGHSHGHGGVVGVKPPVVIVEQEASGCGCLVEAAPVTVHQEACEPKYVGNSKPVRLVHHAQPFLIQSHEKPLIIDHYKKAIVTNHNPQPVIVDHLVEPSVSIGAGTGSGFGSGSGSGFGSGSGLGGGLGGCGPQGSGALVVVPQQGLGVGCGCGQLGCIKSTQGCSCAVCGQPGCSGCGKNCR